MNNLDIGITKIKLKSVKCDNTMDSSINVYKKKSPGNYLLTNQKNYQECC